MNFSFPPSLKLALLGFGIFYSSGVQAQYVAVELLPYLKQSGLIQELADSFELNPNQLAFEDAFLEGENGQPLQVTVALKTLYKQEVGVLTTSYRLDSRCRIDGFTVKYQTNEAHTGKRSDAPKPTLISGFQTESSKQKLRNRFVSVMQSRIFQFVGENESLQEYCNPR